MPNIWRCVGKVWAILLLYLSTFCCCSATGNSTPKATGDDRYLPYFGPFYYEDDVFYDPVYYEESDSPQCPYTGECTNYDLGRTYIIRGIYSSSDVHNIPGAIIYADNLACTPDEGFRRLAVETRDELDFLVNYMLCGTTKFGTSDMKLNIMTAGQVQVTQPDLYPYQVLDTLNGTWIHWSEGVDGLLPYDVVLLDPVSGRPMDKLLYVAPGLYSIFLVGSGKQRCYGNNSTYLSWGLMSLQAEGPVEDLVSYVVCEKEENITTDTTYTSPDTTDTTYTSPDTTDTTYTSPDTTDTTYTPPDTTDTTYITPDTTDTTSYTTTTSTSTTATTTTTTTSTTTTITPTSTSTSTITTTTTTTTTSTSIPPTEECCFVSKNVTLCPGNTLSVDCPLPDYSGSQEVECISGRLEVVDHCIADWINDVNNMINNGSSAVDIAEIIKNETDNRSEITQADLTSLVSTVSDMTSLLVEQVDSSDSNSSESKQEIAHNYTTKLVKIEANLFTYEDVWDGLGKEDSGKMGSSLLHDLEKTGFILANNIKNDTQNFTDSSLNMTVLSRPSNELAGAEVCFPAPSSDTFICLPEDFEEQLPVGETQGRMVVFFLEQRAASRALPAALTSLDSERKPKEINSFLVSMTLGSLNYSANFTPDGGQVLLRLQHTYREAGPYFRNLYRLPRDGEVPSRIPGSAVCVYWDPARSSWVPDGCRLVSSNRDITYCSCSHLSMISVITDIHNYMGRDAVLDILGTFLSSLSCIALVLAGCIFQFCKGVQVNPRISITKQLCVSLFLSQLFLILFLDRDFLKLSAVGCQAIAGVLHYLLMASICWMLAEGLELFHAVHFTLDPTNFMVAYWLVGYGVPAVVVLVTLLVAFGSGQWSTQEAYAPPGSEYCWLTADEGYIWAFTGPLVAIIVVNTIFMVSALHSAAILTANRRKPLHHRVILYVKGSFSLSFVLGVTWVFGLLYINSNHFFAYVFTILNGSQGVMIFVFNCILNDTVWTAIVSSLPKAVRQRLVKASAKGPTSGKVTSGACATFNRSTHHSTTHTHPQLAAHSPGPDHRTMLCNDVHLSPLGSPQHPARQPRTHSDVTQVGRSRQQFLPAEDVPDHISPGSGPSRVSPPDQKISCRKASQWSADTQISFISDAGSSRKNSVDSYCTKGHTPSSSYSSTFSPSFAGCRMEASRMHPGYREQCAVNPVILEEVQRCIHTIPECE